MQSKTVVLVSTLLLSSLFLGGCAKSTVSNVREASAVFIPKPERVLIQNFSVDNQQIKTSSSPLARIKGMISDDSPEKAKQELVQEVTAALTAELSEKIKAMGFTPVPVATGVTPQQGEIMISGRIMDIDEGNAVRRNVIGFGAGQSYLDCQVSVWAVMPSGVNPFLAFTTHADSGNMPGAAVMGPAGAAAGAGTAAVTAVNVAKGAASAYKSASAHQAKSLAEKIATELSSDFAQRGWVVAK